MTPSLNPPTYQYSSLNPNVAEIRLICVLPGDFDDPLCIEIVHVPFEHLGGRDDDGDEVLDPPPFPKNFISKVPNGWGIVNTTDGRWFFWKAEVAETVVNITTSWDFPVPELADKL
jgi:hypothetical protein